LRSARRLVLTHWRRSGPRSMLFSVPFIFLEDQMYHRQRRATGQCHPAVRARSHFIIPSHYRICVKLGFYYYFMVNILARRRAARALLRFNCALRTRRRRSFAPLYCTICMTKIRHETTRVGWPEIAPLPFHPY